MRRFVLTLLLLASTAPQAGSLILSNIGAEIPLDPDQPVRFRRGEIVIACAGGANCGITPQISAFGFASSSVAAGSNNAQLSWDAPGADVCIGEAPTGVPGWSGQPLPKLGTRALTVSASATFTIRCFASYGSKTASATLSVQ